MFDENENVYLRIGSVKQIDILYWYRFEGTVYYTVHTIRKTFRKLRATNEIFVAKKLF